MPWIGRFGVACALAVLLDPIVAAQTGRAPVDVSKLGPQVGAPVPAFSLTDQNGRARTLESIAGPEGALLVFYRSADW